MKNYSTINFNVYSATDEIVNRTTHNFTPQEYDSLFTELLNHQHTAEFQEFLLTGDVIYLRDEIVETTGFFIPELTLQ